jgi:hypothetical protein
MSDCTGTHDTAVVVGKPEVPVATSTPTPIPMQTSTATLSIANALTMSRYAFGL